MLFKYMSNGKEIGSFIGETMKEAKENASLNDIPWETIDEYAEPIAEGTQGTTTLEEILGMPKKTRKPRADKGTKKVIKTRKKPEYFLAINDIIQVLPLTRDKAIKVIEDLLPNDTVRVIMGHEITFTRSVKFHF